MPVLKYNSNQIKEQIREIKKRPTWSQKRLAAKLGISEGYINKLCQLYKLPTCGYKNRGKKTRNCNTTYFDISNFRYA